jgi:TolB-like protein
MTLKIRNSLKLWCVFLTGAGILLAAGTVMAQNKKESCIAVMPFIKGKHPENIKDTMTCPYSSFCYEDASLLPEADGMLTRMAQSVLNREFFGRVAPLEMVDRSFEILKIDHAQDTPHTVVLRLGETLKADYILAGNVWRYRERVGTAFSAERPASVAFGVYLVDMKTRRLIWRHTYDETQQSLFENLFNIKDFFRQGVKWLTAEELARYGMNKMFQDFPLKK